MKVALVYDRVNKWGGAERILLSLHELFPDATLYTSVYNKKTAPWAKNFTIITSFLQKIPYASSSHEYYPMCMPIAFESFSFDEYDLVISISSEAAKGIITGPKTLHICYCLTPTRYLWSGYNDYFRNKVVQTILSPIVEYLRAWDVVAASRPDSYISISYEIQKRLQVYYEKGSNVIYPPVSLSDSGDDKTAKQQENYFLIVSRLVPYKKIDIAIKACNILQLPLKIIGTGSEEKKLKSIAGPTVEFLGLLTEESLVKYYKGCKALLFPGIEDFGITVVEAQSFGKPVIAFKGGGALETILEHKTGLFFNPQTVDALITTLRAFDTSTFDPRECVSNAKRFGEKRFKKEFSTFVTQVQKERNLL